MVFFNAATPERAKAPGEQSSSSSSGTATAVGAAQAVPAEKTSGGKAASKVAEAAGQTAAAHAAAASPPVLFTAKAAGKMPTVYEQHDDEMPSTHEQPKEKGEVKAPEEKAKRVIGTRGASFLP